MGASTKPKVCQSKVRHGVEVHFNIGSRKWLDMQSEKVDLREGKKKHENSLICNSAPIYLPKENFISFESQKLGK